MLWLALQFPRLGLEVWQQAGPPGPDRIDPARPARPTVLIDRNRVVLCNGSARAAGLQPGASLATAHSIVADLAHFQRDEGREQRRLAFLGETLYRFSAQVSLEAPDALVLEIGASLTLFGDPERLAREAHALCLSLGHETRWQLAATPVAALVMAAAGVHRLEDVPLASARLPEGGRHLERLANMGLNTLAPLLELPDVELGRRFGPALVDHLARLVGRVPDPKRFIEPARHFDQSLHLLEPVSDREDLLRDSGPMQHLLTDLEQWLVSHQLGAEQLVWSFSTHRADEQVAVPIPFARAQQSRQAFRNVIRLRLEQVALPEDVLTVRLEAPRLVPWLGGSRGLFGHAGDGGFADVDTSELIDQLRARLGDGACSRIGTADQHTPEAAWLPLRAGAGSRSGPGFTRASEGPFDQPSGRPLWLFDPPRPTARERLDLIRGPERIHTAWWQQPIRRDYYVASLETGARCWAFVDGQNRWYLHGYFG